MTYTPKRGHPVVVERMHTAHSIKMQRTEWSEWHVGEILGVSQDGFVTKAAMPHAGVVKQGDLGVRFYVLVDEDKREGAMRLMKMISKPDENIWPDRASIQQAILHGFLWERIL